MSYGENMTSANCAASEKMPEETMVSILGELMEVTRNIRDDANQISGGIFGQLPSPSEKSDISQVLAKKPSVRDVAKEIRQISRETSRILQHIRGNF